MPRKPKKKKLKKPLHAVTQYATDIVKGKIPANKWTRLACQRHLTDLKTCKKRGLYFDEVAADHIIFFFPEFLSFYEGAFSEQPFNLTPNQQFILGSVFGWKRKADDFRRFRTAYIEQAKGNGKSPIAGGVGLYCMVFDNEPGAEIYAAAVTKEQANILFRDARLYADASEALKEMLIIDKYNIAYPAENSFFRAISSEKRGLDGKRPHVALIDEIHEHPDDVVVRKMSAGMKGRRQGIQFEITNSGYDRHSICFQHHEYTEKILEGIIEDDAWFGLMSGLDVCEACEADGKTIPQDGCSDCDDWRDEKVWEKANPNLNYLGAPFKDYLNRQVEEAKAMPSQENIVKRLNFCIWCVIPETLITMADGSRKRADKLLPGDTILAFDEHVGCLFRAVVKKVADNGIRPIFKITTARGRITNVTGNHRFWSLYGRTDSPKYGWIEAQELCPGNRIAVGLGNELTDYVEMDAGEAYILGVMVGDGNCHGSPRVTGNEIAIIDACNDILRPHGCEFSTQSNGNHHHVRQLKKYQRGSWLIEILKRHSLYGCDCYSKRVPGKVFTGGPKAWSAFLSGYLDTDGYILKQAIAWGSVNHELLSDCQYLLALMGANSSLNAVPQLKGNVGIFWRLEVRDDRSIGILVKQLLPAHPRKAKRLQNLNTIPTYNGISSGNTRKFDRIKDIQILSPSSTVGIEIEGIHTHITDGLITHNTESISKWIPTDKWNACAFAVDPEALKGRTAYGGLDLSTNIDVTAWILIFPPEEEGGKYEALCRFFLPEDNMRERVKRDKVPYDVWVKQGYITITPGDLIDYAFILAQIDQDSKDFDIAELAFDRWGSAKITTDLQDLGFELDGKKSLVQFGQGYKSMSPAISDVETMVLGRQLAHGGHPVLSWMVSNVAIRMDSAGNRKPDKEKSVEKIDGAVALLMAAARCMLKGGPVKSAYDGLSSDQISERMKF